MALVLIYYTLEALKWLIIIRALMSWFVSPASTNPIVNLIRRITDPILRPLSELLPNAGGMDFTPILAFVAIYLLQGVVIRLM